MRIVKRVLSVLAVAAAAFCIGYMAFLFAYVV